MPLAETFTESLANQDTLYQSAIHKGESHKSKAFVSLDCNHKQPRDNDYILGKLSGETVPHHQIPVAIAEFADCSADDANLHSQPYATDNQFVVADF